MQAERGAEPEPDLSEIRCDNIKFAEVVEPGIIEVKCRSRLCGANSETVVIHRFDVNNVKLLDTKRYKNPKG